MPRPKNQSHPAPAQHAGAVAFDPNNVKSFVKDPRLATVYVTKSKGDLENLVIEQVMKYVDLGYFAEDEGFRWKLTIEREKALQIEASFQAQALMRSKGVGLLGNEPGTKRTTLTPEEMAGGAVSVSVETLQPVSPEDFLKGDNPQAPAW